MAERRSPNKGFKHAYSFLTDHVREAGKTRGFSQARILTNWEEIAGRDTAKIAIPLEVKYYKKGLGATLLLLCNGANALFVEMDKNNIRNRVNAIYGYNAITRIKITQTSAANFDEGDGPFVAREHPKEKRFETEVVVKAQKLVKNVMDPELSISLAALARNVLSK